MSYLRALLEYKTMGTCVAKRGGQPIPSKISQRSKAIASLFNSDFASKAEAIGMIVRSNGIVLQRQIVKIVCHHQVDHFATQNAMAIGRAIVAQHLGKAREIVDG